MERIDGAWDTQESSRRGAGQVRRAGVNAGAKVHQWAGMKMHQLEGQWESWFDFWQGEREGDFPLAIAANI
jgi:hypothetical protein